MSEPTFDRVEIDGRQLRVAEWGTGGPCVVLLHDGLGSIPQWRGVPERVQQRLGCRVIAYERSGHGESLPAPTGSWPPDWLDTEAVVLGRLLAAVGAHEPVVVGHSDGGTTALLYASDAHMSAKAVLALAPHSWVEQICFDAITQMRQQRTAIESGLARHHVHPRELFEAWSGVWVSNEFRRWDIRPRLHTIEVPTVIAQGVDDAYASDDQAHLTAAAIGPNATSHIVPGVGHIMHHDDETIVVDLICAFVEEHSAAGPSDRPPSAE